MRENLKTVLKNLPILGSGVAKIARLPLFARARGVPFVNSASYWQFRYRHGGTSGAGSYGRLAEFKASVVNGFVTDNEVCSVVEFGCGDGAQLELANYADYVGIDVSIASVELCSARFSHDPSRRFYAADSVPSDLGSFDLALSLDVIYHLVEDSVFDSYMGSLFASSSRYVIIYSSNYNETTNTPHVRHREFTNWISKNVDHWRLAEHLANRFPFDPTRPRETSFADFYFFAREADRE